MTLRDLATLDFPASAQGDQAAPPSGLPSGEQQWAMGGIKRGLRV